MDRPPASAHADVDSHMTDVPPPPVMVQQVFGAVHGCPLHMYGMGTPPLLLLPLLLPVPLLPPLPLLPVPLLLPLAPLLLLAVPLLPPLLLLPPSVPLVFVDVLPPHAHASAIAPPAAKSKRVFVVFMERNLRT
jgi:hypothetical protein